MRDSHYCLLWFHAMQQFGVSESDVVVPSDGYPCGLDDHLPDMGIASESHRPVGDFLTAAVASRNQTEIGGELSVVAESLDIAQFG